LIVNDHGPSEGPRVGIDIGGTFTDAVLANPDGTLRIAKVLTRTDDRAAGFLDALGVVAERGGVEISAVEFLSHGTTAATNALVENTLARVGFVTNLGFTDMLEIGTQQRIATYGLHTPNPPAVVPRDRCFGLSCRLDAQGVEIAPVVDQEIRSIAASLRDAEVDAVAVCLLFAFKDGSQERHVARILAEELPGVPVSLSSEIAPEIREYTRASTTVLNAALLPLVGRYVDNLATGLKAAGVSTPLYLMQSNGGLTSAAVAAERPLTLAASGPAAGVMGLARIGAGCGEPDLLTFDMGGTTIDVSLVTEGQPAFRFESAVEGRPVNLPQIDVMSIGAGGGSIAAVDDQGRLSVGPASAGSRPGPAAYGLGGTKATVTDAHVVLGTLAAERKLGGKLQVDRQLAVEVIHREVAQPLGVSVEEAASGILRVVNANMSRAARLVSVSRGLDPREFTLASFGGAGGLHACGVAEELQMTKVLVPRFPGVACALGLLVSDVRHDVSHSWSRTVHDVDVDELQRELDGLEERVRALLLRAGHAEAEVTFEMDMRYEGQGYSLTIPMDRNDVSVDGLDRLTKSLADAHLAAYGYVPAHPETEIVSLRATARSATSGFEGLAVHEPGVKDAQPYRTDLYFNGTWHQVPVHDRETIRDALLGPALIEQEDTTIFVQDGWRAMAVTGGNLLLERVHERGDQ
jgi:N-methylhydantoinase A